MQCGREPSTVLVAVLGVFIFKEQLSITQVIFLSLIVIGLAGLNFSKSI
jgi:multidrug transporter EmrE-like cation transporter